MMKKTMTSRSSLMAPMALITALCWGLAFGLQSGTQADTPGNHSGYVHAFYDLSDARSCLTVTGDRDLVASEKSAVFNIDKAMFEIGQSIKYVKKDIKYHPSIDAGVKAQGMHQGRLHRALNLVLSARKELTYQEDNKAARGWRGVALKHIDTSVSILQHTIQDIGEDS